MASYPDTSPGEHVLLQGFMCCLQPPLACPLQGAQQPLPLHDISSATGFPSEIEQRWQRAGLLFWSITVCEPVTIPISQGKLRPRGLEGEGKGRGHFAGGRLSLQTHKLHTEHPQN